MEFELFTDVVLIRDHPKAHLKAGDVGTVVEKHHAKGKETGYSVEFFDMLGNTVALETLPASELRVPTHEDRPSVRTEGVAVP